MRIVSLATLVKYFAKLNPRPNAFKICLQCRLPAAILFVNLFYRPMPDTLTTLHNSNQIMVKQDAFLSSVFQLFRTSH